MFASAQWSSLQIAGVRLGLFLNPGHADTRVGVHYVVDNLSQASREVVGNGGRIVTPQTEVAPGVVTVEVEDPEGNAFTLRGK
jgi:predicted enzyme related to lactoylglutathione lyase